MTVTDLTEAVIQSTLGTGWFILGYLASVAYIVKGNR